MPAPPPDKIPVTINLSPELALRLRALAEMRKRPAAEVVVDLLDQHLPKLQQQKKGSIPYA